MRVYTARVGNDYAARADIECFGDESIFRRAVMEAKRYKILPHLFCDDEITIWIDANIWLQAEPERVATELLGDADMALFTHPYRQTVWDEFAAIGRDPRFDVPFLRRQIADQEAAYRNAGLPEQSAAYECSVLIRRNNAAVNRVMEAWWSQLCRWQWRDQVSLPFALWGSAVKINPIQGNVRDHPMFRHVSKY